MVSVTCLHGVNMVFIQHADLSVVILHTVTSHDFATLSQASNTDNKYH